MNKFTKPMLAASLLPPEVEHTDDIILAAMKKLKKWPKIASLKKDGIRSIRLGDLASRTLKKIPSYCLQKRSEKLPNYLDVELYNPALSYDEIESIVMSAEHDDCCEIQFHILDIWHPTMGYNDRLKYIANKIDRNWSDVMEPITWECGTPEHLMHLFLSLERTGAEGICFRTPDSPYKQGRSTLKEEYLIKLSRYLTSEAVILGFEEQMENVNSEKRNQLGAMKRSSFKSGLVGKGTLGALLVKDIKSGQVFKIGTGFNDEQRADIWFNLDTYKGQVVSYKYKPHGQKDKPRSPVWRRFRKDL